MPPLQPGYIVNASGNVVNVSQPGSSPTGGRPPVPQPGHSPSVVPAPPSNPRPPSGPQSSPPTTSSSPPPIGIPSGLQGPVSVPRPPDPPPNISPPPPSPPPPPPPDTFVRIPDRDVVDYSVEGIDVATLQNLLFENIGANELVKFERHDTIEGTNARYDIISNLSDIKKQFDPSSLISRQKPDASYFDIFTIRLDNKIPDSKYLNENGLENYLYIDTNGDLVIELVNIDEDELVELQIDSSGTIYKVSI